MKLLLIEDDSKIAAYICDGLSRNGFVIDHFMRGEDGLDAGKKIPYDIAIIDLMLPDIDGLNIVASLKKYSNMPVLILSAKRSVDDRVKGLKNGGDDYLTKPFSFEELLARLNAIGRRSGKITEMRHLNYEDLELDRYSRRVTRGDSVIDLNPREFLLLELFLTEPKRVLTKNIILEKIWQYNFDPQTNVVDVLVCRLRSKIDGPFKQKLIHTVRGIGYELNSKSSI